MARSHEVRLTIGSGASALRLSQWDEIAITQDMLRPGSPWTVTLWREGRSDAWARVRAAAKIYSPVSVAIDGAVQLHGVLERFRDGADARGAPFTISGRDLLAGALVSDVDPRLSLQNSTLEEVFRRALGPLGFDVLISASADEARAVQAGARPGTHASTHRHPRRHRVDRFKPKVGERLWAFLEALARRHGFLIYGVPVGEGVGVVIDKPAFDLAPEGILWRRRTQNPDGTYQGNLLSGFLDFDATDVPTDVTVFGHGSLTASHDARHEATASNDWLSTAHRVADVHPARHRYLQDPRARTPQIAEQRARREVARANQNLAVYEATVQGFSHGFSHGQPERFWTMNTPVTVDDEVSGVRGRWLTTQLTFTRSRAGGHTTRLRLVPPGSIALDPDPEV